jgi:hypothetical protein
MNTKLKLYKDINKSSTLYWFENWAISKSDENKISTFERNVLRGIYGPLKVNGEWRIW